MRTEGEKHCVVYDENTATITCSGYLDLRGKEGYKGIAELFDNVAGLNPLPETLTLDLRDLEFLNSSGITTLGGFVIKIRNKGGAGLKILCSNTHSWQARSMKGLQKLMQGLELTFE